MSWLQMNGAVPLLPHDLQRDSTTFGTFTVSDSERDGITVKQERKERT